MQQNQQVTQRFLFKAKIHFAICKATGTLRTLTISSFPCHMGRTYLTFASAWHPPFAWWFGVVSFSPASVFEAKLI
jgi:hypothetical protein